MSALPDFIFRVSDFAYECDLFISVIDTSFLLQANGRRGPEVLRSVSFSGKPGPFTN